MMKWLLAVIFFGIVGILGLVLVSRLIPGMTSSTASRILPTMSTPTPKPFVDMTVPYLRAKSFVSTLSSLEKLNESSNYTAYLTSYASDGFQVNGLLTKPNGEMPEGGWPAIVFVHGYIPPTVYRTTQNYVSYVDFLARNGFVVFKIDLRGHDKSEGEAGGGYFSGDYVSDTLNARAALQTSGFVNPDRIGLWGHSMAGNVVLRSLVVKTDIPAVAIWAGAVYSYSDQAKYGISDNSYRPPANNTDRIQKRQQLFDTYGQFSVQSEFWRQVAPTNYLHDIQGAIQVHHAVDDTVVNIGYSRDLMELLSQTQVPHELFEYSTGGHNITGASFTSAMQRTVDFFTKNL